ncbi:hypothetical protein ACM46_17905 [Chryseobacterium angstadtii]|uniref:DUF2975 domain-containing protein n=1 Tax=Chryseobacterium angstadtii TaxID=558151 RepID=A0A0J7I2U0_9FLAO|nr:DUF2975 domain-containing protein [Chryseobacterium angstadtii]KMQ60116.1 hypothetical protein ACM46_17905 [Chryseobacterium angstadtii]
MNQTKIIARILYYICSVLSVGYLIMVVYSMFCLATGYGITPYKDGKYLHINYPFTQQPFLNIENNSPYIIFSFFAVLISYGVFFWLSSLVFRVFFQEKLFTADNIRLLTIFYRYNIFIPLPLVIIANFFVEVESIVWGLVFIHFMLGIFCLFLANIFKQGLHLQNEQDLFI